MKDDPKDFRPIKREHCGICTKEGCRDTLDWIGKPNPHGAHLGEVFAYWRCNDTKACSLRCNTVDWDAVMKS